MTVLTRDKNKAHNIKNQLEQNNIETWENNIPSYSFKGDIVYRIFVFGNDIKLAKKINSSIPFSDSDLK